MELQREIKEIRLKVLNIVNLQMAPRVVTLLYTQILVFLASSKSLLTAIIAKLTPSN